MRSWLRVSWVKERDYIFQPRASNPTAAKKTCHADNEITSTMLCFFLAFATIFSSFSEISSEIQSAPHCEQILAGTCLTTTTPSPKSTVNVVKPLFLNPPQSGQVFRLLFFFMSSCFKVWFKMFWIRNIGCYDVTHPVLGSRAATTCRGLDPTHPNTNALGKGLSCWYSSIISPLINTSLTSLRPMPRSINRWSECFNHSILPSWIIILKNSRCIFSINAG